jgi:hypothetical protein
MQIRGQQYIWAPDHDCICVSCLYCSFFSWFLRRVFKLNTSGPYPTEMLARISRAKGFVTLEIAASAIHAGLLETIITATFLFLCDRNID